MQTRSNLNTRVAAHYTIQQAVSPMQSNPDYPLFWQSSLAIVGFLLLVAFL
jgi:hypothetical protein